MRFSRLRSSSTAVVGPCRTPPRLCRHQLGCLLKYAQKQLFRDCQGSRSTQEVSAATCCTAAKSSVPTERSAGAGPISSPAHILACTRQTRPGQACCRLSLLNILCCSKCLSQSGLRPIAGLFQSPVLRGDQGRCFRFLHVELEYDNDLFGLSRGQFSALFLLRPGPPGLLLAQAGLLVKGPARRVADSDCISSVLASLAANLC